MVTHQTIGERDTVLDDEDLAALRENLHEQRLFRQEQLRQFAVHSSNRADDRRREADAAQIRQLLGNLLGNALKFEGERPPLVRVSSRRTVGGWEISVADRGIGIPPEDMNRVFELFHRLHADDRYPGTGIGLAICKKIVERHGGRIWAEPRPHGGTAFRFVLPD